MKYFLSFLTALTVLSTLNAQTAEDSVKAAVNTLFEAMKASDAVFLKSVFADSAVLQTITRGKDGNIKVVNQSVDSFAVSVAKQPKGSLNEQIVFDVVKIDGPLAIAWTPYKFYFNGVFSHCGVNSFQLLKTNAGWKIQYLIDTRRKKGCD